MRRLLIPAFLSVFLLASAARAEEMQKPDDHVSFNLAAEDWVTTKTARVTVNVEAAVSSVSTDSMRSDMIKAVNGLTASDWRLVSFYRNQDQTGLERWSANFEARLPEMAIGGLSDNAKKLSKAGMQMSVANVDFSPTLDEVETVRAGLRAVLYKKAADQLAALNGALPGRAYRIAAIDFNDGENPMPARMMGGGVMHPATAGPVAISSAATAPEPAAVERSEKIRLAARVVLAAVSASDAKR
jgi:hypothetical protein